MRTSPTSVYTTNLLLLSPGRTRTRTRTTAHAHTVRAKAHQRTKGGEERSVLDDGDEVLLGLELGPCDGRGVVEGFLPLVRLLAVGLRHKVSACPVTY
jgi:hypothetical protein